VHDFFFYNNFFHCKRKLKTCLDHPRKKALPLRVLLGAPKKTIKTPEKKKKKGTTKTKKKVPSHPPYRMMIADAIFEEKNG